MGAIAHLSGQGRGRIRVHAQCVKEAAQKLRHNLFVEVW